MQLLKEIRTLMGNYHLKSGIYHYYRNEFKQAVDFFHKALRDAPRLSDSESRAAKYYLTQTFVNSAQRHEKNGKLEAAAEDLVRAIEVSPDYADIRYHHGRVLESLGRTEEAIEQYRRAVSCNANYLDTRVALAFCLLRAGRLEEAAEAFGQARELRIRRITEPMEEGLLHLREGRTSEAGELLHVAFLTSASKFEEHYKSALEFLKVEEYEEALEELDRALELNPRFADLHNYRGVALCEQGRDKDGIASFRRSVALNKDYLVPQLNLAFALLRTGQYKDAEEELEAVLEKDPTQHAASAKLEELRAGRAPEIRRMAPRGGLTS